MSLREAAQRAIQAELERIGRHAQVRALEEVALYLDTLARGPRPRPWWAVWPLRRWWERREVARWQDEVISHYNAALLYQACTATSITGIKVLHPEPKENR